MRFDHLSARNAQDWFRLGEGSAVRLNAMLRGALVAALAVVMLPATGRAADPLLSGYGGPGGGEQVVLGGAMVNPPGGGDGGGGSGSGSLRATPRPASSATAPAPGTASPATGTGKPSSNGTSSTTRSRKASGAHAKRTSGAPARTAAPAAVATGAPPVVAYPTSGSTSAGGLAVPVGFLLAALLGLAALVLVGFGLRRLGRSGLDRAGSPQVSGH
jgi:hypothetical protein